MIAEESKKLFINKYSSVGEEKFYKFLLNHAIGKIINFDDSKSVSPEAELIEYHDRFLVLYRRENNAIYLDIAKLFRRAAHKIYRIMLKKSMIEKNTRFLNVV